MRASHHRDSWADLDARREPTDVGRRLEVGGFVFGDPPDALFRGIDADYLRGAWYRLGAVLSRHGIQAGDLSWGCMHPGETYIPGEGRDEPCRFIGWTSRELASFDADAAYGAVDEALSRGSPVLRCAVTWRSVKWRIAGDDALGLRLFEALATDEPSEWSPDVVLATERDESEPWVRAALAVRAGDQRLLDEALASAARAYTPVGYRMVVRGYQAYADGWGLGLQFPVLAAGKHA
jgi:hypothetical protein